MAYRRISRDALITGRRSQQGCAADVPEADLEESDARAKAEPSAGRRLRRLAQEESSKPDPKGGDDSQWKLQESLVQNSQHAAQQHRRQQDRSDPPGESISGATSAVKYKETGDHREDGDGNRWPPQVPRNLGSSSYCRCDRVDAPKGRNSRPAAGPTPSETSPKLVTVTAKKSGATSNSRAELAR